jgi:hypothetical protein
MNAWTLVRGSVRMQGSTHIMDDVRIYGYMYVWVDGWMDGCMDEWIDVCVCRVSEPACVCVLCVYCLHRSPFTSRIVISSHPPAYIPLRRASEAYSVRSPLRI